MNKYKVTTVDGEVEIKADGVYAGGIGGKDLVFHRTGEWVDPAPAAIPVGRNVINNLGLGYGGYHKTDYVAGFNGDYWRSYTLVDAEAV